MITRSPRYPPDSPPLGHDALRLANAAATVLGSRELEEVQRQIVVQAIALTGASKALLASVERRTGELHHAASEGFTQTQLALATAGLAESAGGRPLLQRVEDAEQGQRFLMRKAGVRAMAHVPIVLEPRLLGMLSVGAEDPESLDGEQLTLLGELARWSATAWANATDFEREQRVARVLTRGFVPESLPELPGYETGLLYTPAASEPAGGDVYGAWALPGGETALLLGDVSGEGVETAALSAMVRFFVEAHSWEEPSPAAALERTNAMLLSRLPDDTFVTAFLAVLGEGRLRYCLAGHPPPLLVAQRPRALDSHGLPLGIDATPGYGDSEIGLAPGELLFAYTDGLIEARRSGEMFGLERLTRLISGWASTLAPQALTVAVQEEVSEWAGGLTEDSVALALRRRS